MERAATSPKAGHASPRLVEVVAAFSLATDLGLGQPMEHGLRSCLIATRLADRLDLDQDEREAIYWVTLIAMVGCTGDSSEMTEIFGDDIAFRAGMYDVGPSQFAVPRYLLSRAGSDGGPLRRVSAGTSLVAGGMSAVMKVFVADCEITSGLAERLGLGDAVSGPVQQKFARWDGKGIPRGVAGEEIPLPARMLGACWRTEATHRLHGADAAVDLLSSHAGATLDPNLVSDIAPLLPEILGGLEDDSWDAVVEREPARPRLTGEAFDSALEALGDFADLKSRWFSGHSRAVSELSEAAGWRLGLQEAEITLLRRAALVHSLGRTGVPNTIWDKEGPLSGAERERMQLYPYLTDRILRRGRMTELAEMASASQERLDGSGYPRGLAGGAISTARRVLAAADVYQSMGEARPHRPALSAQDAAAHLRREVKDARLDAEAAEAVLDAAGHPRRRRRSAPAGLTEREVEVLRLIARGATSAEAAGELGIQPKTVGTHIEHIYSKIGASNRSVATLFAMEHGLL